MYHTSSILYIAVDSLVPERGNSIAGLDEFTASLDHAGIPAVWLTTRSRLQVDNPLRKFGHNHPFITEGGCGAYLPEDYFHLRPQKTIRLGRFTCIPVADPLPAASETLQSLSEDTGIDVVTLKSLSPRELVQNSGLPAREAELARQRDFDELFFFAGASEQDIQAFVAEARKRRAQLRQHGALWSIAMGPSTKECISQLSQLYDRALRSHASAIGMATPSGAGELFPACSRNILLVDRKSTQLPPSKTNTPHLTEYSLHDPGMWAAVLENLISKK